MTRESGASANLCESQLWLDQTDTWIPAESIIMSTQIKLSAIQVKWENYLVSHLLRLSWDSYDDNSIDTLSNRCDCHKNGFFGWKEFFYIVSILQGVQYSLYHGLEPETVCLIMYFYISGCICRWEICILWLIELILCIKKAVVLLDCYQSQACIGFQEFQRLGLILDSLINCVKSCFITLYYISCVA